MNIELDELQTQVATALRATLTRPDPDSVHGALVGLGLPGLEIDPTRGGLGLGLAYGIVACEELGRVAAVDTYRAGTLLAELADATPDAEPLVEAIVTGSLPVVGAVDPAPTAAHARLVPDGAGRLVARAPHLAALGAGRVLDVPAPVLVRARVRQAAYLVGLAAGAHAIAVDRGNQRRQFGRAIGGFQTISFGLAADASRIVAARLLTHHAAWLAEAGPARSAQAWPLADQDPALAAAGALATAAELATTVTSRAVHLHGAHGLTDESVILPYHRRVAVEAVRWGAAPVLWREAGRARLARAGERR